MQWYGTRARDLMISIHAPREGCDRAGLFELMSWLIFQSTHPVRGATMVFVLAGEVQDISIHAPREGCDSPSCSSVFRCRYFNPRTP